MPEFVLPRLIAVRLTAITNDTDLVAEIREAEARGGLEYDRLGGTWLATQEELDTSHVNFRLSPR